VVAILVAVRNHIERLSSREVYRGRLVHLREDSVILPQGTRATFEYVEIKNGASTLAVEENGDVWLVREWKYAIDRPSLEVVSGGIEPGEEPLAAAQRELREEAGLTAAEWTSAGFVDPFTTMVRCPNHLFLARGLTVVAREPEEGEVMEIVRMPLEQAVDLVINGGITHGASSVLILKAAALRRS
jgi:ADP-ribose pyrophosphatase